MKPAAWYSAAVTAAILPLIYWVTWRVLTGPFNPEVQSFVAGAVVGTGLGTIVNFWMGTSASSQRKDERQGG